MKRIAIALIALSGVASAQGSPFSFTVPFPDVTRLQAILRSSAGYGDDLGLNQSAEIDVPIGSRVVVMASSGVTFQGPGALHSVGQLETIVDAIRFAGWHLALSGGVRRQYDGTDYALARLSLSRTTGSWTVAANAETLRSFLGGPSLPQWMQYFGSVGATAKVVSGVSLGGETFASEGRAVLVFFGPVASFTLPGGRARLDLSGGPNICTAGNCAVLPDYTLISRYATPFPAHQSGYTLRLALSVGL